MKRQLPICATAIVSLLHADPSLASKWKATTWDANTGALSYSFFNLSGDTCTIVYPTNSGSTVAVPSGPNPLAPAGSPAQSFGWNGYAVQQCKTSDSGQAYDCVWDVGGTNSSQNGIFTTFVSFQPYTGSVNITPSGGAPIFFQQGDPVQTPVTIATSNSTNGITTGTSGTAWSTGWTLGNSSSFPINGSSNGITNGTSSSWYEGTAEMSGNNSSAAVADSFSVQCGGTGASSILVANFANAGTSFNSGETNDGMIFNAFNADFNPQAPSSSTNPSAMGFVANASQVANLNQSTTAANYQGTGGLWSAMNNPNTQAAYSLVPAMLPINLSNWVNLDSIGQTAIYGGHFTVAIGDPFIISGFNAKILWYLATQYAVDDSTFTTPNGTGYSGMLKALTASSGGVFGGAGYANDYVNWLFNAASQAAAVTYAAYQYAGHPSSTEAFWGKVLTAALNAAIGAVDKAYFTESGIPPGAVDGVLRRSLDPLIVNAAQTNGNAPPAPTLQTAPVNFNATFSAGNLMGLLMANIMVQTQLNTATDTSTGSNNPLWANYSMYNQKQCVQNTMMVTANEFPTGTASSGVVQCYDTQNKNAATNLTSAAGTYVNLCTYSSAGCTSDSGTQLSIWDAVTLGSDITASANGQTLLTSNPSTAAFSPPTLIADASVYSVNTTFNATTGVVTLASYTAAVTLPSSQPTVNSTLMGWSINGCSNYSYTAQGLSYDATTGILTATQYQGGCPGNWNGTIEPLPNGPISLNMNTCATGSAVNFNAVATLYTGLTSATLSCVTPAVTEDTNVTLDYNLCVNDPHATGGVLAVNLGTASAPQPALACACIPFYAGGAQATSGTTGYYATGGGEGILLGATSASSTTTSTTSNGSTTTKSTTTQQCAVPTNSSGS